MFWACMKFFLSFCFFAILPSIACCRFLGKFFESSHFTRILFIFPLFKVFVDFCHFWDSGRMSGACGMTHRETMPASPTFVFFGITVDSDPATQSAVVAPIGFPPPPSLPAWPVAGPADPTSGVAAGGLQPGWGSPQVELHTVNELGTVRDATVMSSSVPRRLPPPPVAFVGASLPTTCRWRSNSFSVAKTACFPYRPGWCFYFRTSVCPDAAIVDAFLFMAWPYYPELFSLGEGCYHDGLA